MFAEKTIELLKQFIEERHGGKVLRASKELGIPNDTLNRWVTGQRDPSLSKLGPILDKILWQNAEPKTVGTFEVTFPAVVKGGEKSAKDYEELKERLRRTEAELAEKNIKIKQLEAVRDELKELIFAKNPTQLPEVIRENKSSA